MTDFAEKGLLGRLLKLFEQPPRLSTMDWAREHRFLSGKETSVGVGRFDPEVTPYMEYLYDCLDNPWIPEIGGMKSARIGWTEVINNYRARIIHTAPRTMLLGFPTKEAAKTFAKSKWAELMGNTPIMRTLVNVGVGKGKETLYEYFFPGGSLRLVTLGSINNQKGYNIEHLELEEPDDAKDDVNGQGDTLSNLRERQKTIPTTMKKFIFGGTPSVKGFSKVDKLVEQSNRLVFKAECHNCKGLVPMDYRAFDCIKVDVFPERHIDPIYGEQNPESATFLCPFCEAVWTDAQKNENVRAGKKHGFVDHTGGFSKGWHAEKPEVTSPFGFTFSELLSPFPASSFVELAKARILAERALAQGQDNLMKSYLNNRVGIAYDAGTVVMEEEEMKRLRLAYTEGIVPAGGLVLTAGIDVQHNRFALVVRAWGRDGNSWLVGSEEIFGNVKDGEDAVWSLLTDKMLRRFPHEQGGTCQISGIAIDSSDGGTTELVYRWVVMMGKEIPHTFAVKGVRSLEHSNLGDEVYREPVFAYGEGSLQTERKTLAQSLGVVVYQVGAHKAQEEVLRRISLLKVQGGRSDRWYFCETRYGGYEAQMTSCKRVMGRNGELVFKLIPGRRKEFADCEKMNLWVSYALGIRFYEEAVWVALEHGACTGRGD